MVQDFSLNKYTVMQVDGNIHDTQQVEDTIRENWLKANGFQVIRFRNEQILNHIEAVLNEIANVIDSIRTTK
jgi:very-short-patch-repair endonuclease